MKKINFYISILIVVILILASVTFANFNRVVLSDVTFASSNNLTQEEFDEAVINTISIACGIIGILAPLFIAWLTRVEKKKKSQLTGGIFFEERKAVDTRKDYVFNRTHHILTKNNYSLSNLQATDEYFDEDRFLIFVKNVFIKLQKVWSNQDIAGIESLEKGELFQEHLQKIEQFKKENQKNVIDEITVHSVNIHSYEIKDGIEKITVLLNASMINYVIDEATSKVLEGLTDLKANITYEMIFERKKGIKTEKDLDRQKRNFELKEETCPTCGAKLDPKLYGWCEYCMGLSKKSDTTWVLSFIEIFDD